MSLDLKIKARFSWIVNRYVYFQEINVIGIGRVLNRIKLFVTLYLQSHLSFNNGLLAFVLLGSSKDSTKKYARLI